MTTISKRHILIKKKEIIFSFLSFLSIHNSLRRTSSSLPDIQNRFSLVLPAIILLNNSLQFENDTAPWEIGKICSNIDKCVWFLIYYSAQRDAVRYWIDTIVCNKSQVFGPWVSGFFLSFSSASCSFRSKLSLHCLKTK